MTFNKGDWVTITGNVDRTGELAKVKGPIEGNPDKIVVEFEGGGEEVYDEDCLRLASRLTNT